MYKKNYKKQYLHPKWQKKRLEVLERDGFKCRLCGSEDTTLHVHHEYYVTGRDVWDYPNEALKAYCEGCHKVEHKKENNTKETYALKEVCNFIECPDTSDIQSSYDLFKKYSMAIASCFSEYLVPFIETSRNKRVDLWNLQNGEYCKNPDAIEMIIVGICNKMDMDNFNKYILLCFEENKIMPIRR